MCVIPGQSCWNYGTPSWVRAEHRSPWIWTEIKHHENHHWKSCKEPMTALSKAGVSFSTNLAQNPDSSGHHGGSSWSSSNCNERRVSFLVRHSLGWGGVGLTRWAKREAASNAPLVLSWGDMLSHGTSMWKWQRLFLRLYFSLSTRLQWDCSLRLSLSL